MEYVWCLFGGMYGDDGNLESIYKRKQDAINDIKCNGGYKYNKEDDLYCNDDLLLWYRIDKIEIINPI